jgi:primosomal replication protein N
VNRLLLSATVAERGAPRHTPAGLPALDLQLDHAGEVQHEGQARKVNLRIKALAIGSVVPAVAALGLRQPAQFAGFLAPARNGRGWLFHITEVLASPG